MYKKIWNVNKRSKQIEKKRPEYQIFFVPGKHFLEILIPILLFGVVFTELCS